MLDEAVGIGPAAAVSDDVAEEGGVGGDGRHLLGARVEVGEEAVAQHRAGEVDVFEDAAGRRRLGEALGASLRYGQASGSYSYAGAAQGASDRQGVASGVVSFVGVAVGSSQTAQRDVVVVRRCVSAGDLVHVLADAGARAQGGAIVDQDTQAPYDNLSCFANQETV